MSSTAKTMTEKRTTPETRFDFLGYNFQPRRSKNRWGKFFINFSPAVSNKATKAIRQEVRRWNLPVRSDKALDDLARMFNAQIRGWVNYYGVYYKSALYRTLRHIDRKLVLWATRKFKRLRSHKRRADHWPRRIARRQTGLFAHWRLLHGQAGLEEPDERRRSRPVREHLGGRFPGVTRLVILVRTNRAGERVKASVTRFLAGNSSHRRRRAGAAPDVRAGSLR